MSGVTLKIMEGPTYSTDESGWAHYHYKVKLSCDGRSMTIPWMQGEGITHDPTAEDVLEAVLSDAATIENSEAFEDWAEDLGFDPDSRKAEKIYRQSQQQTEKLKNLLGVEYASAIFPPDYADSETVARRLAKDASSV